MKISDVRVERTYKQLFKALLELLGESTFEELSVSKLCEKSGVHRATFYKHFDNKYEFLDLCIINKLSEISFTDMESNPTPENIKNNVMNCIKEVLIFLDKNKEIVVAAVNNNHTSAFINAFYDAVVQFCMEKFTGILKQDTDKMLLFSNFYAGAFVGIIKWYVKCGKDNAAEDVYQFCERRIDEIVGYYATNLFPVVSIN